MRLGIVGVTGMVGNIFLNILEKKHFSNDLYFSASDKSIGKKIFFKKKEYKIIGINELILKKLNVVLFSAGSKVSKKWAPIFAKNGTFVIDNSSAWRMDKEKKLIVPEINASFLRKKDKIIANPNCSTIQLVMVLYPLHIKYNITRVIVSTYQSVTGTGKKAVNQLNQEQSKGFSKIKVYPHPIYQNVLPHCDSFIENGYSVEEMKLINETKKIMNDQNISITSTSARVPVIGGHSESVNITFKEKPELNDIRNILKNTKGVVVQDKPKENIYPMPIFSYGKDEVFVGRIREDFSFPNSINLWIVSDNLRKGAATNAIQILEFLLDNNFF
ncbi:aspartate-semialdehyde dehydrogenase [Blattabacterium cuenoti]|uniref:aspartate-semialdehyde dehydrogenase n=1 Tax=Blattabacterium cuenoti TaxID=1653831 RepID=UPI00163B7AC7|nr:aspartate-semialdehyde dehydrogenase [Blattabacterium cuenoti]